MERKREVRLIVTGMILTLLGSLVAIFLLLFATNASANEDDAAAVLENTIGRTKYYRAIEQEIVSSLANIECINLSAIPESYVFGYFSGIYSDGTFKSKWYARIKKQVHAINGKVTFAALPSETNIFTQQPEVTLLVKDGRQSRVNHFFEYGTVCEMTPEEAREISGLEMEKDENHISSLLDRKSNASRNGMESENYRIMNLREAPVAATPE